MRTRLRGFVLGAVPPCSRAPAGRAVRLRAYGPSSAIKPTGREWSGRRPADRKADWPPAAPSGVRTSRAGWRAENKKRSDPKGPQGRPPARSAEGARIRTRGSGCTNINLNARLLVPALSAWSPKPNPRSRPGPQKPTPTPPRAPRFWPAPADRPAPRGGGLRRTFLRGFRPGCVRTRDGRR